MKISKTAMTATLVALAAIVLCGAVQAQSSSERFYFNNEYEVTIVNITQGQVFSPPVVVSHERSYQLFQLGAPASPELAALAEDGMTQPLIDLWLTMDTVGDYATAGGPLGPGESVTLTVSTMGRARALSVAGMLVTTNDAFFAIHGLVPVPFFRMQTVEAPAYDAGSELNSEDCSFIPGPPCGNPGMRDTAGAEGHVYVHPGIHGTADLDPALRDWRNPVALIRIRSL